MAQDSPGVDCGVEILTIPKPTRVFARLESIWLAGRFKSKLFRRVTYWSNLICPTTRVPLAGQGDGSSELR